MELRARHKCEGERVQVLSEGFEVLSTTLEASEGGGVLLFSSEAQRQPMVSQKRG